MTIMDLRRVRKPQLIELFNLLNARLNPGVGAIGNAKDLPIASLRIAVSQLGNTIDPALYESLYNQVVGISRSIAIPREGMETYSDFIQNFSTRHPVNQERLPSSFDNLTPKQEWVAQQINKKKYKSLVGEQILVTTQANGQPTSRAWEATIVSVAETPRDLFVTNLVNGDIYNCFIYQFEILKEVPQIKPTIKDMTEKQKAQNRLVVQRVADTYNNLVNRTTRDLSDDIRYRKASIRDLEIRLKRLQTELVGKEKELKNQTVNNITPEQLIEMVEEIESHEMVRKAFISKEGNIIIITKMLNGIDRESDKEMPDKPLGEFVFKICLSQQTFIAINLTYINQRRRGGDRDEGMLLYHPNISGTNICWGDNINEAHSMLYNGSFYQLIDFAITFFSTFPHEQGANPYQDFQDWDELKEPVTLAGNDHWHQRVRSSFQSVLEEPLVDGVIEISAAPKGEAEVIICDICGSDDHLTVNCEVENSDDEEEEYEEDEDGEEYF